TGQGTCTSSKARALDPPYAYTLLPGSWDFFAVGPTFTCSPGPASEALVEGPNDTISWGTTSLLVTGAPGGTLWAVDAAKVPGTLVGCPGAAYVPVAINVDAARSAPVVLPAGTWYVDRTSAGAADTCLGNSAGGYPLTVPYNATRTLAWTMPNATVTVTGAGTGGSDAMVYSTSATPPSCTGSNPGNGLEMPEVSGNYRATLAPGTYYMYSWNQRSNVTGPRCVNGGSVVVGGQTAYTLPFNTTTRPVVGP
ncbi:MAG: type secretion system protein, partial [Actinotalea sp.]|nr:type secretion system protein [Actinotalea sp.]